MSNPFSNIVKKVRHNLLGSERPRNLPVEIDRAMVELEKRVHVLKSLTKRMQNKEERKNDYRLANHS